MPRDWPVAYLAVAYYRIEWLMASNYGRDRAVVDLKPSDTPARNAATNVDALRADALKWRERAADDGHYYTPESWRKIAVRYGYTPEAERA